MSRQEAVLMKKILVLIVGLVFLAGIAGCGGGPTRRTAVDREETESQRGQTRQELPRRGY